MWEIAALQGTISSFDCCDSLVYVRRADGATITTSHEAFDDLYYVISEFFDAAMKKDCIEYKIINTNGDIVLRNVNGKTRTISMGLFLKIYTI